MKHSREKVCERERKREKKGEKSLRVYETVFVNKHICTNHTFKRRTHKQAQITNETENDTIYTFNCVEKRQIFVLAVLILVY